MHDLLVESSLGLLEQAVNSKVLSTFAVTFRQ